MTYSAKETSFSGIARRLMPAMTVLIAGVMGMYLVYDNYLADRAMAAEVIGFEPSAGASENNTASSLPDAAASKVQGHSMKATDTATQANPSDVKAAESDAFGAGNKPAVKAVDQGAASSTTSTYTQEGEDSAQPTFTSGAKSESSSTSTTTTTTTTP